MSPESLPGAWMVQSEYQRILESSLKPGRNYPWYAWLHLGVMRLEALDEAGAASAWEESLRVLPNAWAYRNLAFLRKRQLRETEALELYEQAWRLVGANEALRAALAVEYLQALFDGCQYGIGWDLYRSLPTSVQETDRIQLLKAQIALELGLLAQVEPVFDWDFAVIREGQTLLTDLWYEWQARKLSAQSGEPLTAELRQRVRSQFRPPARIDFRSVDEA